MSQTVSYVYDQAVRVHSRANHVQYIGRLSVQYIVYQAERREVSAVKFEIACILAFLFVVVVG